MKETKMYEIQIETKDGWHNLLAFGSYEEIEELGEILSVDGLPDGTDLESDFDALKAYDGMNDLDQKIVLAYYEATDNFDPEEAMEAFAGRYLTPESFCEDIRTLYWGGTSADWDCWFNVAGLSNDEEEALKDLMQDKMAWYDPLKDDYTIEPY